MTPMTDDEQQPAGGVPRLFEEFFSQLRAGTERLEALARSGTRLPPGLDAMALPGAISAAQVNSIADSIVAQRRSIEALKAQLSSFDEQLAVLEGMLEPLAEWSRRWADIEQRLLNPRPGHPPEAG
jgi:hypothetical protein